MKKSLLIKITLLIQFFAISAFAQQKISGKIVDSLTNESLPGASIGFKGTRNFTSTSLDGSFSLQKQDGSKVLIVSFIGYNSREIILKEGKTNLGNIKIVPNSSLMSEVAIIGSNVAIDRKTPVAVSTINAQQIEEKGSSQEFPELLNSTPGVQATKQGGGFGDSRISIRGFSTANLAIMVNGIPINDMENGSVYWSNWASLRDVTSSMQVQRGLGATKLVVPSLGGTINIITKSTDVEKGGSISQTIGNDGFLKTSVYVSTGMNDKGWAFSAQGSRTSGNMYAEGLQFTGYNYFFNLSKKFNDHHTLSLTGMGAPQWHGQRSSKQTIQAFEDAPQGIKFNPDWGVKYGQVVNVKNNYFNKPIVSLTDYWTIDESSSLSTVLYASQGIGGGGSNLGSVALPRVGGYAYAPYDLDAAIAANKATVDGAAGSYLYASINNHNWFGAMSTYNRKLNKYLNFTGGVDLRYYQGTHYVKITDLLGADYVSYPWLGINSSSTYRGDINNPNPMLKTGDKFEYNYNSKVLWEGASGQVEYSKDNITAFASLAASNTSYKRIDFFNYTPDDPARTTPYKSFLGYQAKGGANYNLDEHSNVFANIGYLEKAPIFTNVFLEYKNFINPDAKNEKMFSYELGYGYRSKTLTANINLYRSTYRDRARAVNQTLADGTVYTFNLSGVNELHQGVEFDFRYRPIQAVTLSGMLSMGDWKYLNDIGPVTVNAQTGSNLPPPTISKVYLKGLKVGNQAQTTAALGLDVQVLPELKLGADYNYYGNYNADFNFYNYTKAGANPWKIPNYSLLALNAVIKFKIANLNSSLIVNVNNVLNTKYVADAYDANGTSTAAGSTVFYGFGRTWTTGLKINF
ncbi:TonB-dependent receptor [Pedobacter cryoconitis]|uniref:Outer membrane cobalamin receptor n=1 Tax=Pedobacter cryoconitis TaxID=188932 RepID=A0A7X0J1L2_9SPHI|nr:TonB-dependent receptor [Pedobacter cryoconitis]MBB6499439.1 outer membrane cobalamin receptor [Pedobacter cryoconitis]